MTAKTLVKGLFLIWVCLGGFFLKATAQSFTFAIVPQQSAQKLAEAWQPLFDEIERSSGIRMVFRTAPDIPAFEERLANEDYDFAYMNPYHYTVFSKIAGYRALARERDKKIKGIVVVANDHPAQTLADLSEVAMAFPAPLAFAATLVTKSHLLDAGVEFQETYVRTHDSVYLNISHGRFEAGGGVYRTFNNMPDDVKSSLRVLWSSPGYTPHAIAAHSRVDDTTVNRLSHALEQLSQSARGREILSKLGMSGFSPAKDADWDDVRQLNIAGQ